ncbi:BLUF domain-containing protein [Qipengyuania sp. XHP0207]|uniref:BLUF domain-containing protein n=1 Tax=Qipengyuania sp. XHP0207 TaxID=3038078 RepID=UPI00241E89DB|nr:BLUF domain-containing protein [Qipengyuania sp. XHP0207]MDG5748080.1 BLUF domain-containing protein [Qipengyuania sp. XHP0207]
MQQLLYRSIAADGLGSDAVFEIVETSARNNPAREVTGFLVRSGDVFLQLVEGPTASLDELLAVLAHDPRHHSIEVLVREEINQRSFPRWRMERVGTDQPSVAALLERLDAAKVVPAAAAHIRGFFDARKAA